MPNYSYEKTFTAGKDATSQEKVEMPCAWGVLKDVTISFPAGCHGYMHVHIDDELHQIFPTNAEATYSLDNFTLHITDTYVLPDKKRKIYLRGWNEGAYEHTISVTFTVTPYEEYNPVERVLLKILNILERLFGKAGEV